MLKKTGTARADTLRGASGEDWLLGLAGNDVLEGLAGNDRLDGGTGADTLRGGAGNDVYLVDNPGDLVIETSGAGLDSVQSLVSYTLPNHVENLLLAGSAPLNATGNALANVLEGNAAANVLDGKAGSDTVSYLRAPAGVVVSLAVGTPQATGGGGSDTLKDVENLVGSAFADVLGGNAGDNVLEGGAGNDVLDGGDGADTASYAAARAGVTVRFGSALELRYGFDDTSGFANPGLDPSLTLPAALASAGAWSTGDGSALEAAGLKGQGETDRAIASTSWDDGNAFVFSLQIADGYALKLAEIDFWEQGSSGGRGFGPTDWSLAVNGTVLATGAALRGNPGAVHLLDVAAAAAGLVLTGTVSFTLSASGAESSAVSPNPSNAAGATWRVDNFTLHGSLEPTVPGGQATGGAGSDTLQGIENLRGSAYADTLAGDNGANVLGGLAGNDTLWGLGGADTLSGGDGNDSLLGGAGADLLLGGAGNDVLDGGVGNDLLSGGAGNDRFRFNASLGAGHVDTITDFAGAGAATGDVIELDHRWFLQMTPGALPLAAFVSGTNPVATAFESRILYDPASGALSFDRDGSLSTHSPVQFALLGTHPAGLTAADFLVV